jgi:SAM-dependent methyltransferase
VNKGAQAYYAALAPHYDGLPIHRPMAVQTVARAVARALQLETEDLVADLCCGTGLVAHELLREVPLRNQIVAVDGSKAMLDRVGEHLRIRTVEMDAMSFAEFPVRYDKILLKDATAHFPDPSSLFRRLHERLAAGGRLLVADLAPESQTWLFKEARRRWESLHRRPEEIAALLEGAGLQASVASVTVRQELTLADRLELARRRYMPVLATFEEGELRARIDEVRERCAAAESLEVAHRFDLVVGRRATA